MSDPAPPPEPFGDPPRAEEIDLEKVHGSILREHNEPAEGRESVPLWLVGIFLALVFWGGLYLAYFSGGFRADAFNPRTGMADSAVASDDPAAVGKRLFTQNCALCHQATGLGVPGVYPPLAGSEWVSARDWRGDNHLVGIVLHGMQGPVQAGGGTFNNAMPPWQILRDEEIAAVLSYIRSQWGNSSPPIAPDFVKQVREQTSSRSEPWSQNELRALARVDAASPSPAPSEKAEEPLQKARR